MLRSRPISRLLVLAAMVAVVFGCARVAGPGGHSNARAVISQATGELKVTNSRSGQAIFEASGLAPGRSVTGTVELANTGTLAGALTLAQLDVLDQPGVNGGRLSDAVQLSIQDVTGGSSIPVYGGQLRSVGSRTLGSIAPGASRTYRFTASLPDSGAPATPTSGDNAYLGSGVSVRYSWTATAPDGTGGGGGGGGNPPVAPVVKVKVVSKKLLKKGVLDLMTTCDIACRVTAYAQLPRVKKGRRSKATRTRSRTATLMTPNKAARIRLKVSKKAKRQLKAALRKKRKVALTVRMTATPASGGPARVVTRKAVVKRPKKRR